MRKALIFFLIGSLLAGCQASPSSPEPARITHTYQASDATILNPERGFFTPYNLPGSAGFSPVRSTGNTLVHLNIRLDDWRETDIPQEVLDGLEINFDDIGEAGLKAIIRFAYNQGPFPDSEPDASKAQILRHIEQLTPLLQSHADVIAWLEAGFIGAWGEWHTSTNGLDNIQDKQEILFALLDALPTSRTAQVRYPANIIEMFPEVLTEAEAFSGSNQARVGHHNDCFLSSDTDVGTYERDGTITIERDQVYLTELTRFTPMSGETCAPYPPRSECASALQEMALLHFTAINEAYHKGILRSWAEGGCLEEINNRLGYRLSLVSADFNEQVKPGGMLDLTVNLTNTGFGSIVNKRPVTVVLAGGDDLPSYPVELPIDPRHWEPGSTTLTIQLHIPSNADEGEYRLALWLPDGSESLRENPLYAIQFANEATWEESAGFNILGSVSITKSAGGKSERGKEFSVLSAESQTIRLIPAIRTSETPAATPVAVPSELIRNPSIENDAQSLSISFEYAGEAVSYNGFQAFLDADQDPGTGMSIGGVGADFLVENDTLNVYAGSGSDWAWTPVDIDLTFTSQDQLVQWTLARMALGNPATLEMVFQLVDTNWDAVFTTRKLTYTIK